MVSAVSNQAATSNPLAYMAPSGDTNFTQSTVGGDGRDPATIVTMSDDAFNERRHQAQINFDVVQSKLAEVHRHMQQSVSDSNPTIQETYASAQKTLQETYTRWKSAKPVPAVQLTDAQIAQVLMKAKPLGFDPSKIGSADNYGFGMDGKLYIFRKDGTAWMNDDGVPTSEQQRQDFLESISTMMSYKPYGTQHFSGANSSN
jgi:hypothetical protein